MTQDNKAKKGHLPLESTSLQKQPMLELQKSKRSVYAHIFGRVQSDKNYLK